MIVLICDEHGCRLRGKPELVGTTLDKDTGNESGWEIDYSDVECPRYEESFCEGSWRYDIDDHDA